MSVGLLWYDNSAEALPQKIERAVRRYEERFGAAPNVCYVHPAVLPDGEQHINQVTVRASGHVLQHHLWVAHEESPTTGA